MFMNTMCIERRIVGVYGLVGGAVVKGSDIFDCL
jgi:hypothetical protein